MQHTARRVHDVEIESVIAGLRKKVNSTKTVMNARVLSVRVSVYLKRVAKTTAGAASVMCYGQDARPTVDAGVVDPLAIALCLTEPRGGWLQ